MKFILEGYFFNRALLAWIIILSEWKKYVTKKVNVKDRKFCNHMIIILKKNHKKFSCDDT